MARDIAVIDCKLMTDLSYIDKARLLKDRFYLDAQLYERLKSMQKVKQKHTIEMWTNFNKLCLNLSKADGTMNFKEIHALNAYDFYLLKQTVQERNKPKGSATIDE